jgi:hypothetical protein
MRMLGRSRGFVQRWCYVYRDHGLDAGGGSFAFGSTVAIDGRTTGCVQAARA